MPSMLSRAAGQVLSACVLLLAMAMPAPEAHAAAYATAGKSGYRDNVLWLTWGGEANGRAGQSILKGAQSTARVNVGGQDLLVTCTMGDISHDARGSAAEKNLVSYAPGDWSADYMDDWYNIGGTGKNNRLIAGLMRKNGQASFNISCGATLGGEVYRIRGLVVADAESMNTTNEIIEASALGHWNVVEMNKTASGNYTMKRSTDRSSGRQTVSFGPGTDSGTAATMFLSFSESAFDLRNGAAVDMRFRIIGGGNTAIAIGLLVPMADYGDAPASYGEAVNLIDDMRFANDSTNGADGTFNLNASSFRVGGLAPPVNHYLGTVGPDAERGSLHSVNADGDDNLGGAWYVGEEDAWPAGMTLSVLQAGERLTHPVVCKGNGEVAGWIDFDRNGRFDPRERAQAMCVGGQASLTWIIPAQLTPGGTYVRLRYRPLGAGLMDAEGVISGGEVEDHRLEIIGPQLSLAKTNNSDQVGWYIGQTAATYTLTVRNLGPVATGNPPSVEAQPVLIEDLLPDGIAAGWDGRLERDGWRCEANGQRISCSYPGVIGAAGSGNEVRSITLPVHLLAQARGQTLTNHAAVGGGHDPHNGGQPPVPGPGCSAAGYCASSSVVVPEPAVTFDKQVELPNGPDNVREGDLLLYTLRVVVAQGNSVDRIVLGDTLGSGLEYHDTVDAGGFSVEAQSAQSLAVSLPAATPPGTYLFRYRARVVAGAQGYLVNTLTASGGDNPRCAGSCATSTQLTAAQLYSKQVGIPGGKAAASVGDELLYTLQVRLIGQPLASDLDLVDDLGDGLEFVATVPGSPFLQLPGAALAYRLPAGTPPGEYRVQYRARVTVDSDGQVTNAVSASGGDGPVCDQQASCQTRTPVIKPVVTVDKVVDASGSVSVGDVLAYTVSVTISGDKTAGRLRLLDLLGRGLAFEAVEAGSAPQIVVDDSQLPVLGAELAAGTAPGTYLLRYRARVTDEATAAVGNVVTPSGIDRPACGATGCSTSTPVQPPQVSFSKQLAAGSPADVVAGQELVFEVEVRISGSRTTDAVVLDDSMDGLAFAGVASNDGFLVNANDPTRPRFELPAGSAPGNYRLRYLARVLGDAQGAVTNALAGLGGNNAGCQAAGACQTGTPVRAAQIAVNKSVHASSQVAHGDVLQYTLTVDISGAALTQVLTLADIPGPGQAFLGWDEVPAGFNCPVATLPAAAFSCTMAIGTPQGRHQLRYSTRVLNTAAAQVTNALAASNPPGGDAEPVCGSCTTQVSVVPASITVNKAVDSTAGIKVVAGSELVYTIGVEVGGAALGQDLELEDVMTGAQTFARFIAQDGFVCAAGTVPLRCVLPAGSPAGSYRLQYAATVDAGASGEVANTVRASNPPGGDPDPVCQVCTTVTPVFEVITTVNKYLVTTGPVRPGDLLTYLLEVQVENGALTQPLTLRDTLPAGLEFVGIVPGSMSAGLSRVGSGSAPLEFVLAAGSGGKTNAGELDQNTFRVQYTARVAAAAAGVLRNVVVAVNPPGGDPAPRCGICAVDVTVARALTAVSKRVDASGPVKAGDVLTYTIEVEVSGAALTEELSLVDTLSGRQGLPVVTASAGFINVDSSGNPLTATLPAGTLAGVYRLVYTTTVAADASGMLGNTVAASNPPGGDPDPVCSSCTVTVPVLANATTVNKSVDATGPVKPGDVLTYTIEVEVTGSVLTADLSLTDTLAGEQAFQAVTAATGFTGVAGAGKALAATLPAGTLPGVHRLVYTAVVGENATASVGNAVVADNGPGGDAEPVCGSCTTTTPVVDSSLHVSKQVAPAAAVAIGDELTYTVAVQVGGSVTTDTLLLTDTLGTGLEYTGLVDAGPFTVDASQAPLLRFSLAAGALPGSHQLSYRARITDQAGDEVTNSIVPDGAAVPAGGVNADGTPVCDQGACHTATPLRAAGVTVDKRVDATGAVQVGDLLTYTLEVQVAASRTRADLLLTDTLGTGLGWAKLVDAGPFQVDVSRAPELRFILPAGTAPGSHVLSYQARVDGYAVGSVENVVVASGPDPATTPGGSAEVEQPSCGSSVCRTRTPVVQGGVEVSKTARPGAATRLEPGDMVDYRLGVRVTAAALGADLTLVDTPDPGLEILVMPAGCRMQGAQMVCVLPAGTPVGEHGIDYRARVRADASGLLGNQVTASLSLAGLPEPACVSCVTEHAVALPELRLAKAVSTAEAKVGDLVRYSLTLENLGKVVLRDGHLLDQPPAGFTLVEGSWTIDDADGSGVVEGQWPIRFGGLDVAPGETATISYVLRVGAGVRSGNHVNTARVHDRSGEPVSNNATASVRLGRDPLIDDARVLGTVFDDRDGDGWQDSADLPQLRVRGGAAAAALVDGSVLITRDGAAEQAVPGSLAQGLALGVMPGRTSDAHPATIWRLRQQLRDAEQLQVLEVDSGNGLRLQVASDGTPSQSLQGDLAGGRGLAGLTVGRSVSVDADGRTWLELELRNDGVSERGLPGVRVASVEGLLMTTDRHGRYHLEGVDAGSWEQGRQQVLKVDPATLPAAAGFTTDNPLLRRLTPGLPVRMDFGVRMPDGQLRGQRLEEAVLGTMLFAPGSAQVASHYQPQFQQMVQRLQQMGGAELVIRADGEQQALALARAQAVHQALLAALPAQSHARYSVRVETDIVGGKALMAAIDGAGVRVGSVLFDTDKSDIRPAFVPVLDALAALITSRGGGRVAVIGHTDLRLSHAYNTALGLRRARAVHQALSERLPEALRQQMRVQVEQDASAPVAVQE